MKENPTNGKSPPEKPAGFSWHREDTIREFFSGSSKFEVSSSDLMVGTKGGGAGYIFLKQRRKRGKKKFLAAAHCQSPSRPFSIFNGTAAPAFNLANTSRLRHCSPTYYSNKRLTLALPTWLPLCRQISIAGCFWIRLESPKNKHNTSGFHLICLQDSVPVPFLEEENEYKSIHYEKATLYLHRTACVV